ncbi:MAG: FxsA family protein [Atribacterota bacterium]|nr:FxsA family protein [Atribacterota bacterium]MDD3640682.1 FxsA family protein [Atribacterota bacterium]MDD4288464.1 FxsA family protein [Atribacterota bacterium]
MILSKLILLFIFVPFLELYILLQVGKHIGVLLTIIVVIVTGIAGAYLVKKQGLHIIMRIKRKMNEGIIPTDNLMEGVLILIGGILLLTPGFITDIVGFIITIPQSRKIFLMYFKKLVKNKIGDSKINYTNYNYE